jgi:hypothetical protein
MAQKNPVNQKRYRVVHARDPFLAAFIKRARKLEQIGARLSV